MLPTVKHTSSLNCKVLWLKITRWSDQKVWKCRWATNHSMLHCVIFYLSKTILKCRNCEKKKFLLSASIGIKRESSNQVLPVRCTWLTDHQVVWAPLWTFFQFAHLELSSVLTKYCGGKTERTKCCCPWIWLGLFSFYSENWEIIHTWETFKAVDIRPK